MVSWDGTENLESFEKLKALEEFFGGSHAIVVNTKQTAVQLCLEVLGTRAHMISVVLPVTTSIETFTGVLYSGAAPIVFDVDTATQQVKLEDLQELLSDGEGAIVLLDRAAGYPVAPAVLEAVQDVPTIAVVRCPPHSKPDRLSLETTFTIYDLSEVIGTGAVIFHKYRVQQQELRMLRGGPLGHKAWLTEELCQKALTRLLDNQTDRSTETVYQHVHSQFGQELKDRECSVILPWEASDLSGPIYFQVPNAAIMEAHLQSYGIPCRRTFYPLHKVPEVARRMPNKEGADYSGAEMLHKHTIMLPTHWGISGRVPFIIEKMMEVTNV
jgi:dTDP-4-amino-4,6-dideoxygalactose transaminase